MTRSLGLARWILLALLALLAAAWLLAVWRSWPDIAARPARVAYLLSDTCLVLFPGVVVAVALGKGKPWSRTGFAAVVGALQYAVTHNVCYLLRDDYLGVSPPILVLVLFGFSAFTVFALRAATVDRDGSVRPRAPARGDRA